MSRNPNWVRDELILALELYFRIGASRAYATDPEVIKLSELLSRLPIHEFLHQQADFRNPSGVAMKLGNFMALDPDYRGKGLSAGAQLDKVIWEEFSSDRVRLETTAVAIRRNYNSVPSYVLKEADNSYETSHIEGQLLTRLHRFIERNKTLVKRKKELVFASTGTLACEVCNFNFYDIYGELGRDFIECHHIVPLALLDSTRATRLQDLAIVCSNCHSMLHKPETILTLQELREIIRKNI